MHPKRLSLAIAALTLLCAGAFAQVRTGVEVLRARGFEGLTGKKVGLLTNPSGVDSHLVSTIEILFNAPGVELKALFAPEHGVRGDVYAGGYVSDFTDPATGLPVYAVYGKTRKPTPEMLQGLDVVVYDIQDVGSRSYTFISSLGLMMQACAEQGIEVMVLDRPNPLGGLKVEGSFPEAGFYSFIGQYPIPYVYGLTVGELAQMINEEGMIRGQRYNEKPVKCNLTIIPMEGWERKMRYNDTGLPWVLPSPNIPYADCAIGYPSSGICGDLYNYLNIGIGYSLPFCTFAATWIDADKLKDKLDSYDIPGTVFRTIHYKPFYGGNAGKLLHGVQFHYDDYEAATITLTQFYVMQAVYELYGKNPFGTERDKSFDKACGTDKVRESFKKRFRVSDMKEFWDKDVESFKQMSTKYYLYD